MLWLLLSRAPDEQEPPPWEPPREVRTQHPRWVCNSPNGSHTDGSICLVGMDTRGILSRKQSHKQVFQNEHIPRAVKITHANPIMRCWHPFSIWTSCLWRKLWGQTRGHRWPDSRCWSKWITQNLSSKPACHWVSPVHFLLTLTGSLCYGLIVESPDLVPS